MTVRLCHIPEYTTVGLTDCHLIVTTAVGGICGSP